MEMENRHVSWWGGQPLRQELCVCFLKNSHYIHAHKHTHTHTHTHTHKHTHTHPMKLGNLPRDYLERLPL